MDRFKFRVVQDSVIYYPCENGFYGKIYTGNEEIIDCGNFKTKTDGKQYLSLNLCIKNAREFGLVIEQCTGLKDKNGKLIYENDVVRFINDCGKKEIGFVDYDRCSFFINNPVGVTWYRWAYYSDFEIIGNIHENPELLEEYND